MRAVLLVLLGLLLLLLAAVILRTAWVSDDAFITFRTVDNALNGYGLRWNVAERVQSYTHPLWMLLLLAAVAVSGNPYVASLVLSFALTAVVVALLVVPLAERPSVAAAAVTVLLFSKAFVDYSTSGLENPLSHALLAALMVFTTHRVEPGLQPRRTALGSFTLGLLVALIGLSRLDLLLIALPIALAAILVTIRHPTSGIGHPASGIPRPTSSIQHLAFRIHQLLSFTAGLTPLAAWTLFSIAYYGVPFPNTAYAKLSTGVPQEMLTAQGFRYLGESFDRDPLTLPVIAAAMLLPLPVWLASRVSAHRRRTGASVQPGSAASFRPSLLGLVAVSVALVLYLVYVVRIGGDFMSGRFLAAPLVVSVFVSHRMAWPRRPWGGAAIALVAAGLGLTAREPSVALLTGPSTLAFQEIWTPHGVVDERSFYFKDTAFLTRDGLRTGPRQDDLRPLVADLRDQHPRTVVYQTVGMAGYYVGPDRHIIDTLALCDPLLARLPAIPPWRIGHYQRPLPEGYWESVDTNTNRITDPDIAALYDRIRLATRAPLWTLERWGAIVEISVRRAPPSP